MVVFEEWFIFVFKIRVMIRVMENVIGRWERFSFGDLELEV